MAERVAGSEEDLTDEADGDVLAIRSKQVHSGVVLKPDSTPMRQVALALLVPDAFSALTAE